VGALDAGPAGKPAHVAVGGLDSGRVSEANIRIGKLRGGEGEAAFKAMNQPVPPISKPAATGEAAGRCRFGNLPGSKLGNWRYTVVTGQRPVGSEMSGLIFLLLIAMVLPAQVVEQVTQRVSMKQKVGEVTYLKPPNIAKPATVPQPLDFGEGLRTAEISWAVVGFPDATYYRVRELTLLEVVKPNEVAGNPVMKLNQGAVYYAHHRPSTLAAVITTNAIIKPKGTEFLIEVEPGRTRVVMYDGEAEIENDQGRVRIRKGEAGVAEAGQPPRTARLETLNIVQWWLYYPAVLDLRDLPLAAAERERLKDSLAAYEQGDLLRALRAYPGYPTPPTPDSSAEKLYYAGLLLSVGSVDKAEALLDVVPRDSSPARALRRLIAAVTSKSSAEWPPPATASEWLALSYQHQSRHQLARALEAAQTAARNSPGFAFAWERVAELEFSFGRTAQARAALQRALELAPRLAEAHALDGFLLAAANRIPEALARFDEAIRIDPGLGNAWLGRGLSRMRKNDVARALEDLHTAAVLEPNRSLLHSYLGKALQQTGESKAAGRELDYARRLDGADPTPWFYSALLKHQENRVNEAIADLEASIARNDNRAVYRSRLGLDEDAAVRRANLALLYEDAGMEEAGFREAARGVNTDYANFSGHLFLANSYTALLDPGRVTLRYETAAVSEYLLANLLAPVGAGPLSPTLSQQEYSKLFASDGWGLVSDTEYLSRGSWRQQGAVYGTEGNTSAALEALYHDDNGQRPNNRLELLSFAASWKQQLTESDQLFGQVQWGSSEGGDLTPRYDPHQASRGLSVEEWQEPIVLGGYQHQWSPGNRTLMLGTYWDDTLEAANPDQTALRLSRDPSGQVFQAVNFSLRQSYESEQNVGGLEVQQIFQKDAHQIIAGARYQAGTFHSRYHHRDPDAPASIAFTDLDGRFQTDFERASVYGYYQWQIVEPLSVQAGLTYDWMRYPANFRYAPLDDGEKTVDRVSPKVGLAWNPSRQTTILAAYSRSLTGASLDQSLRLEPSQIAGINQAYRSVIPDAVTGANSAEKVDAAGVLLDHKFPTRTYLGLSLDWLWSKANGDVGVYYVDPPGTGLFTASPGQIRQRLDYEERAVGVTLNQLLGNCWSVGAGYRLARADLEAAWPDIPAGIPDGSGNTFSTRQNLEAWLHTVRLYGLFNHPSGFFARAEAFWRQQSNQGYAGAIPGDDFWQINLLAGWRFLRRRAEVTVGVLNVTDQDYRLNPLNITQNLPRDRTFMARLKINF
jgi:tetratricopeptide (TPR) repeat protein